MISTNATGHIALARPQLSLTRQLAQPRADRRPRLRGGWS